VPLRSWTSSDNRYEVDVLLQYKDLVIPIEVKACTNISSPSLKAIKRLNGEDFPLRMADQRERLITLALKRVL